MKKGFIVLVVVIMFANVILTLSCSSKKEDKNESADAYDSYETAGSSKSSDDDLIAQGKVLMESNDCRTCHHITNKIIGPAYTDVAKKYEFTQANITLLADKIIRGGSGIWGQIPMTPHGDVSRANAEKMAMFVLSLDGEKPSR